MPDADTWTEFVDDSWTWLDRRLPEAQESWESLIDAAPPLVPADVLCGASVLLAELVAARGVAAARSPLQFLLPRLPDAYRGVRAAANGSETVEGALWFDNLVETSGFHAERAPHAKWLDAMQRHAKALERLQRHSFAFLSLAYGEYDRIPVFLGAPLPNQVTPGASFEFDYPSMLLYFGAACRDHAAFDAVEPAWLDFLQSFPYRLGAEAVEWPHLFCMGRAVYHHIQGMPVGEVARETHKQIMQLIAQGK
jgi:hypothetical protein